MKIINQKPLIKVVISKPNSKTLLKEYNALIDTGATKTFISKKIVDELNLDKGLSGVMSDASGNETKIHFYTLNLLLYEHSQSIKLECGIFPGRKECDVIIGMDIISYGKLLIENNELSFFIDTLK